MPVVISPGVSPTPPQMGTLLTVPVIITVKLPTRTSTLTPPKVTVRPTMALKVTVQLTLPPAAYAHAYPHPDPDTAAESAAALQSSKAEYRQRGRAGWLLTDRRIAHAHVG